MTQLNTGESRVSEEKPQAFARMFYVAADLLDALKTVMGTAEHGQNMTWADRCLQGRAAIDRADKALSDYHPDGESNLKRSKTHAVVRTSPKGGPFIGRCIQCGREGLKMGDALEYCDNLADMSQDDALIAVLDDPEPEPSP
jgi:hypothetical protein